MCSRAQSVRGVRGGVVTKLRGFERIAEDSDLSSLALRLRKEEKSADGESGGKIVLYTTSMKAIRDTHAECIKVTRLFGALRVKFDVKDVLLNPDFMEELRERVGDPDITVPQVFINGDHVGDGEMILDMNETGELTDLLKDFEREYIADCSDCGSKRFVACLLCQGSKKGKRSSFGTLKCTQCNQHALQPCPTCSGGALATVASSGQGDDVIMREQPQARPRAMTAPSSKPGRLDVSTFERRARELESQPLRRAVLRKTNPLPAASLTIGTGDQETTGKKAEHAMAALSLELAGTAGAVRGKAKVFEAEAARAKPGPSDRPTAAAGKAESSSTALSPNTTQDTGTMPTSASLTATTTNNNSSGGDDFDRRTRQERIQFALQLARSTDESLDESDKSPRNSDRTPAVEPSDQKRPGPKNSGSPLAASEPLPPSPRQHFGGGMEGEGTVHGRGAKPDPEEEEEEVDDDSTSVI